MTLIKDARTSVLYGLGGMALGLGLFVATTWFGIGFRIGSLHLPTILIQIVELAIAAGCLFLVFAKSEVCGKCDGEFDEVKLKHHLDLKDQVKALVERVDLAGLAALDTIAYNEWQAVEVTYGGCPKCGEVAYLEVSHPGESGLTVNPRKILEGDAAKAVSRFVAENSNDD